MIIAGGESMPYHDRGDPKILVRMPAAQIDRLRRYSADVGRTMSDVVREAIERYFADVDVPAYTPAPADGQMGIEDMPTE